MYCLNLLLLVATSIENNSFLYLNDKMFMYLLLTVAQINYKNYKLTG